MPRSNSIMRPLAAWCAAVMLAVLTVPASADEGMWTLDNLPLQKMHERYGFIPSPEWVAQVQKACVNFGGGSGSFVSPQGLVLTNHHVALGQLQKISSADRDYVREGFFARTQAEEMKCPDLELRVLISLEDVTARVKRAIDPRATGKGRNEQRKAAIARIEKESSDRTKLQSNVVELYQGGEYWLYRYKKYTDVRLVMAPEQQIAFYGGDPDNFSYPRHDLDFAFFRAYENGRPAKPEHWFRWSAEGPKDQELVLVPGHPGSTGRLRTVAQLEYERDISHPIRIRQQERRLEALRAYAALGPEQARRSADRIFGLENNLKRQRAYLEILRDPGLAEAKRNDEAAMRTQLAGDPKLSAYASAWDRIAEAQAALTRRHRQNLYSDVARSVRLASIANQIVRYVAEVEKPNEKRFEEYRESNLQSLRFQMFSPAPIYPELDAATLAANLTDLREALDPGDAFVRAALGGRAPRDVADELMSGTKLGDVAFRRKLVEGGRRAVEASQDPLIAWARGLDAPYRELRAWYEDSVQSVEVAEGARIAEARFALYGKRLYPDATGSLRLSYGKVAGYEQLTTQVPWKTTFFGLYDRTASFDGRHPFDLPTRVAQARGKVDLSTPLNFVTTNDIIGGNSGSPVINRELELVGLVFDGNVQAFRWAYDYDDAQARTVAVHSSAIIEALRKIYDMGALADELTGRSSAQGQPASDPSRGTGSGQ